MGPDSGAGVGGGVFLNRSFAVGAMDVSLSRGFVRDLSLPQLMRNLQNYEPRPPKPKSKP